MKIAYVANSEIPSKSANSIHVMKICEAFKKNGADIILIVPNIEEKEIVDTMGNIFDFYGIECYFTIKRIENVKRSPKGLLNYYFALKSVLLAKREKRVIITRNPIVSFFAILFGVKHCLEMHGRIKSISRMLYRLFGFFRLFKSKKLLKLIVISKELEKIYLEDYKISNSKIEVLHDGVTLENFKDYTEIKLKEKDYFNITYVGSLFRGKGIDVIFNLAKQDKQNKYHIYGGEKQQVNEWISNVEKLGLNNIHFYGHISNKDVPPILNSSDILLMPYQKSVKARGNEDIAAWMSPLKMFEYMASGRIIISSDLTVIREVLTDKKNAFLVSPEKSEEWLAAIRYIYSHIEESINIGINARKDVQKYSWDLRAKKIIDIFNEGKL